MRTVLTCTGSTRGRIPGEKWFYLLISGDKMQRKEGKEQLIASRFALWPNSLSYRNKRNCHTTSFVKQKHTAFEWNSNNLLLPSNYPFRFCGTALSRESEAFFSPRDLLSNTSQIITQRTRRPTKRPSLSCHRWQINRLFHGNTSWSPAASLPKVEEDCLALNDERKAKMWHRHPLF